MSQKSDLGVRTLSAIVMVAVAGTALWLGGWWWTVFACAVGLGVLWEWSALVNKFETREWVRAVWIVSGTLYISGAVFFLISQRLGPSAIHATPHPLKYFSDTLQILLLVVAIDVGAYFAGRTFGGPKIAPRISPSKTWAGLLGASLAATLVLLAAAMIDDWYLRESTDWPGSGEGYPFQTVGEFFSAFSITFHLIMGTLAAIVAQSGDFFESWMKRRAGVKDSGSLIPGHGGLFDRTDGLLAVCFGLGVLMLVLGAL